MPQVSTRVTVPVPLPTVFDFLADARNLPLWSSGVTAVGPEAVAPGTGAVYRYRFPGRRRDHRLVCRVCEPGREIRFRGQRMWTPLGTQTPEYAFRLSVAGRGTEVELVVVSSLGWGMLLLFPLVALAWRRDLPIDAGLLAEVLAQAAAEPAGRPKTSAAWEGVRRTPDGVDARTARAPQIPAPGLR